MTNAIEGRQPGQNWRLTLAYDGTDFFGWQVQPGLRTIQGELREAIERVTGEQVLPQGSGRTDAGVHALGQVASFPLAAPIPPRSLARALNRVLPASIRVLGAEYASESFHARHSARTKTYEYRIFQGEICPPMMARYVYACARPMNVDAMRRAASRLMGEHDFTSFAASDPDRAARIAEIASRGEDRPGNIRKIHQSEWATEGKLLIYRVGGNGFLHHMVRNFVGTLLDIGCGRRSEEVIEQILAARSRQAAGPTAPARGLFLIEVVY